MYKYLLPSQAYFVIAVTLLAGVSSRIFSQTITLSANKAEYRDNSWVRESKGYWHIHTKSTLYKITKAKMTWTFPGPTGYYNLKERLYTKQNGPAPCWVVVDGKEVWRGETPLPPGQNFIYCCSKQKKPGNNCNKNPSPQKLVWVDAKINVLVKKGAKIEHWGQTAYHCQPSNWKPGVTMTGYGGGTYSGFAEMQWIPSTEKVPVMGLSAGTLVYNAKVGGADPDPRIVTVDNIGGGTMPALSAQGKAAWLTVTTSGAGNKQTLANKVSIAGLKLGKYSDTVTVSGTGIADTSYIVELNVLAEELKPVTVLSPNGGEEYKVGDAMTITWKTDENVVDEVVILISTDNGRSWVSILAALNAVSVRITDPNWGKYVWTIPPKVVDGEKSAELNSPGCRIMVGQYPSQSINDVSDANFSIGGVSVVTPGVRGQQVTVAGRGNTLPRRYLPDGRLVRGREGARATGIIMVRPADGTAPLHREIFMQKQ